MKDNTKGVSSNIYIDVTLNWIIPPNKLRNTDKANKFQLFHL